MAVVVYGRKAWSVTLKEECRVSLGPVKREVRGECRKMHNEQTHYFYYSPNIDRVRKSRRIKWAKHVSHMGDTRTACGVSVGKPGGKETTLKPWDK
jgi:hypothetical protein